MDHTRVPYFSTHFAPAWCIGDYVEITEISNELPAGKIHTHQNVDLDAILSVLAIMHYVDGFKKAEVVFHPADWDGSGMADGDIAADIFAGGKGIKGICDPDGTLHSAFASIIARHAPEKHRMALAELIQLVDAGDTHSSAVRHLIGSTSPEMVDTLDRTGLHAIMRAIKKSMPGQDLQVIEFMKKIFSGFISIGCERLEAEKNADKAELFGDGSVGIIWNATFPVATSNALLQRPGIRVVIYVSGRDLGLIRRDGETVRMDHQRIRKIICKAAENLEWFAHPSGFLYSRGTAKAPSTKSSAVDPRVLARVMASILSSTPV